MPHFNQIKSQHRYQIEEDYCISIFTREQHRAPNTDYNAVNAASFHEVVQGVVFFCCRPCQNRKQFIQLLETIFNKKNKK